MEKCPSYQSLQCPLCYLPRKNPVIVTIEGSLQNSRKSLKMQTNLQLTESDKYYNSKRTIMHKEDQPFTFLKNELFRLLVLRTPLVGYFRGKVGYYKITKKILKQLNEKSRYKFPASSQMPTCSLHDTIDKKMFFASRVINIFKTRVSLVEVR